MTSPNRCPYFHRAAVFLCTISAALILVTSLSSCNSASAPLQWQGQTMGTYYRITVPIKDKQKKLDQAQLQSGIEAVLSEINQRMSTYIADSELSRFNRLPADSCQQSSEALLTVVAQAVAIHSESNGHFNPLVEPLVRRWGFGAGHDSQEPPTHAEVEQLMANINIQGLQVNSAKKQLCKTSKLQIDLSALAKGYAVDEVADWLQGQGIADYLVDIGGEIKVAGLNPQGRHWRLAVEKPDAAQHEVFSLLQLTDRAVATSGDYRNFFEHNGQRYSHTIDPATGYPTTHNLASVTVVHHSAMLADAWATALLAAGPTLGKVLAQQQELAVFFIQRNNSGNDDTTTVQAEFSAWHSEAMQVYFVQQQPGGI